MDATQPEVSAAELAACEQDAAILANYKTHLLVGPKDKQHFAAAVREGILVIADASRRKIILEVCAETEQQPAGATSVIQCNFDVLLQILAAAIEGSADNYVRRLHVFPMIARSISGLAQAIEHRAPTLAATLATQTKAMYVEMGLDPNGCHCSTCAAIAAIEIVEQELDAVNGPTLSEWIDLVSRYRVAVDGLTAVVRSPQAK